VFDKRGTGLSDPVGAAPTFEERMDDIRAVMDAVGSDCATLIGYSEGGSICALFAATYPERVSSLILYDAWAAGPLVAAGMEGAERWKDAMNRVRATIDHWGDGDTIDWIAPSLARSAIHRRFWGTFERASMSPGMARALMDALGRGDIRAALPAISAPTLVLHHPDAPIIPSEQGRYLAEHIANARYVELPGPDHAPVGSEMETIGDEIQEFLTGTRAAGRHDRVLVTVLFTDIVDSTKRAAALGDSGWRELLERHYALVRSQLERFGGREVKQVGDGFVASFDGPARAIRCACSIGEESRELGLELRAGLHSGECELIGDDLAGVAVHVAARVGAMARPGEVLVSGTLKDLVMGSGIDLVDRGGHELKGVPGEWRIFAVRDDAGPLQAVATGSQPMPDERLRIADRATWRVVRQAPGLVRAGARALRLRSTKD
jgi:class 3 adenylate cyclase